MAEIPGMPQIRFFMNEETDLHARAPLLLLSRKMLRLEHHPECISLRFPPMLLLSGLHRFCSFRVSQDTRGCSHIFYNDFDFLHDFKFKFKNKNIAGIKLE